MTIRTLAAALLLTVTASTAAVAAEPAPRHDFRPQITEEQKAEMIRAHKARVHEMYQKRITIIGEADSCIQGAESREAFRACRETEKQQLHGLKAQWKDERAAKRNALRSNRDEIRGEFGR